MDVNNVCIYHFTALSFLSITLILSQIQGAIIVASLIQILVGMTGIVGFMLRYIGPLVIAPTVCLTGLSLFDVATDKCQVHWGVASLWVKIFNCINIQITANLFKGWYGFCYLKKAKLIKTWIKSHYFLQLDKTFWFIFMYLFTP